MPEDRSSTWLKLQLIIMLAVLVCTSAITCCAFPEPSPKPLIKDSEPMWSPNSKKIAFISNRAGEKPGTGTNLWLMSASGTDIKQLVFDGKAQNPTWSPDGTTIAYQSGDHIFQVDASTGEIKQLTDGNQGWFNPDWHPTDMGRMACAYKAGVFSDSDLWVINPYTSSTRETGKHAIRARIGRDIRPRWSRDGKLIAFIGEVLDSTGKSGKWYLMTMLTDGTGVKTCYEIDAAAPRPTWYTDCSALLLDGGTVYNLAERKKSNFCEESLINPDIAPNGRRVVYCAKTADGNQFIFSRKINGTDKKQLTQ